MARNVTVLHSKSFDDRRRKIVEDRRDELEKLHKKGVVINDIAVELNTSLTTALKDCVARGLDPIRKGQGVRPKGTKKPRVRKLRPERAKCIGVKKDQSPCSIWPRTEKLTCWAHRNQEPEKKRG